MPRTSWEKLGEFHAWVPSNTEQQAIANYLSIETGRIDTLTSKKRRLIDLFTERRQAVIERAVAGDMTLTGLDTVEDYKDQHEALSHRGRRHCQESGSSNPSPLCRGDELTWRIVRLDAVAQRVKRTLDPHMLGDTLVDHYSIPHLESTGGPEVMPALDIMSAKQLLRGGEVMVSRLNPRKSRVVAVPLGLRVSMASGEFVVMRPHGIEPRFLTYLLLSETVRQHLDSQVQSVTRSHQRVRPEVLMKMKFGMPNLDIQKATADYLDVETGRIDALISKTQGVIDLLAERRQALITAAVTGALAIPGVAA